MGRLRNVRRGVSVVNGAPPSWRQAVRAVLLTHVDRVAASHWTALPLLGGSASADLDEIHVITDLDHQVVLDGVVCHRSGVLEEGDLIRRDEMLCTSPLRTVIDLSGPMTVPELGKVVDEFLRLKSLNLEALRERVDRTRPAPGRSVATLRKVLAKRLPGYDPGESELEGRIARIIDAYGLPRPAHQHRVRYGEEPLSHRLRLAGSTALLGRQRFRIAHVSHRSRQRRSTPERTRPRWLDTDRDHLADDRRRDRSHHPPIPRPPDPAFVSCGPYAGRQSSDALITQMRLTTPAPMRGASHQTPGWGTGRGLPWLG